ncbi:helix-turn-helix domain-containing protein [Streptosporangium sp. 'caverna']|uniref:helix-turn-helix domain-containing protein n=1 Tax=Streptosporangium sp. 'caverna' TaxID=2202249 RepID=UPI000D7D6465|nr:helix-turn-helix domain-containing protein [Streptosporangium sp. 'caverna']AWS47122.1 AfsR family transcriptional regulator [Streptosporangium sp. 'caverna']
MLRRHRQSARLTLEQLAGASGVSARTLSDMERGRSKGPQHRTVTALADALGLDEADRRQLVELAREGRLRDRWTRPTGLCELPRSVDDFTGRTAELAWTRELVHAGDAPGVAGVGLITGSAGLGKTTLAVRVAHTLRPSFPDGVFFLDLFGMSPQPLPVDEALGMLLRALGVADQQVPGDVVERASLYRSLLHDRRVLVVLDNATSEDQVRPLLPGGGAGKALVTSRRLLAGLEGVRRLSLGPLPLLEAAELLTGILKDDGASDEGSAIRQLAQLCGGLPLALRIAGNRLVSRPGWDAADLAARLMNEERRLDQLSAGDLKVATAFGLSYEQLTDSTRRVFRRLAPVPGWDFDAALAAVVGGTSIDGAWDALDELVDLGLLQDSTSGRYRFHDLVRLFARGRLQEEETTAERDALTVTMTSWLLRMATTAGRWFDPAYIHPDRPDAGPSSPEEADHWLRANVDNWLGALRTAASDGRHSALLDCAESMHWFSDQWMHAPHWHEVFTLGAESAAALGDPARQATQLNLLAWVHLMARDDPETTLRYTAQAMDLATRSGATTQIAWAHHTGGGALRRLGRLDEATAAETQAAETFKADGNVGAYCQCLGALGTCLRDAGRHTEALEQYLGLLALLDDDQRGMTPSSMAFIRAIALARVGECLGLLGRRTEAIIKLTEAIGLMEQARLPVPQAHSLETLAALLSDEGRTDESRHAHARAAEVYEAIGDAEASGRCRALANAAP